MEWISRESFLSVKTSFYNLPNPTPSRPRTSLLCQGICFRNWHWSSVYRRDSGKPPKLFPVAFFSRKLSPADRNYDIGNQELLATKLTLEERIHWFEGATHPFIVSTNHSTLEYLCTTKQLNARQALWSLFFTQFNFSISYPPGSKNVKADALSRLYPSEEQPSFPPSASYMLSRGRSTKRFGTMLPHNLL